MEAWGGGARGWAVLMGVAGVYASSPRAETAGMGCATALLSVLRKKRTEDQQVKLTVNLKIVLLYPSKQNKDMRFLGLADKDALNTKHFAQKYIRKNTPLQATLCSPTCCIY